jgi:hypothetical protein
MTLEKLIAEIDQLTGQSVFWKPGKVLELLVQNTGDDKAVSLKNDQQIGRTWGWAVGKLFILGFPQVALQTAEKLYELQLEAQEAPKERLHKGVALQVTGETYLRLHRFSLAKRYFQLALIEDTIQHRENVSSDVSSYKSLTRDLNVPSADLDQLIKFTLGKIADGSVTYHPEKFYTGFLLSDARPRTRDVEREIFRINSVYAQALLEQANNGATGQEKGDALEELGAYLLSCVDGFEIVGKKYRTKDYEIDILVRNTITQDPILAGFGPYILVECKNWGKPVGTAQVNHFLSKIQFHDCHCGIIIAKTGISGYGQNDEERRDDQRYANLTILKAFHRNGVIVMKLDGNDLERVVSGKENILSISVSEYERIRFDRSK